MELGRIALVLFGDYWRKSRPAFPLLTGDLAKARLYVSVDKWLSIATLYALMLSFLCLSLAFVAAAVFFNHVLIWGALAKPVISDTDLLRLGAELGLTILVVLACFLFVFLVVFLGFALYPQVRAWERKRKIDGHLPYAIGWMASMASVGVTPYMIFKKLSEAEQFFGEVSNEAKLLVRNVEVLGFDFMSGLRSLAANTPSTHMRTFIQGTVTSALSGGEMGTYFISKGRESMAENRKRFADFITGLGLISEVYIAGLVAAPLFVIVMFTALAMMGGASPMILVAIIYVFIPLGSLLLLLLTDALTPEGIK